MDAIGATMKLGWVIDMQYFNVSLDLKRIEILHILFSNTVKASQKCLFDLVMLYAKVHDNKM